MELASVSVRNFSDYTKNNHSRFHLLKSKYIMLKFAVKFLVCMLASYSS